MLFRKLSQIALVSLLFIHITAWADPLCDPGCIVEIDFTNGGSIEAVEDVTFTFGNSGLIDTGSASAAYQQDQTLNLNAGESLTFLPGGSLSLGTIGNIDYSNLTFNIDGNIRISSGSETTAISIASDQVLSFIGNAIIEVNTDILNLYGTLHLGNNAKAIIDTTVLASHSNTSFELTTCSPPETCGNGSVLSSGGNIGVVTGPNNTLTISANPISPDELSFAEIDYSSITQGGEAQIEVLSVTEESENGGAIKPLLLLLLATLWVYRYYYLGRNT